MKDNVMYYDFIRNGYVMTHNLVGHVHKSIFRETLMELFSLLIAMTTVPTTTIVSAMTQVPATTLMHPMNTTAMKTWMMMMTVL